MKISIVDFRKIILLLFLLAGSLFASSSSGNLQSLNIYILVDVAVVIVVFYDPEHRFSLLFVFMALLALFHFGQVFLNIFSLPITTSHAYDLFSMYSEDEIKKTLRFCIISYNLIALSACFVRGRLRQKSEYVDCGYSKLESERDSSDIYYFGKLLFWILLIPIVVFDITIAISGLSIGYMARYTYQYPILSDLDQFFPMVIICLIAGGNEDRKWKGYYCFALVRIAVQMFTVGNRSSLIIYLILYELTRHNCHFRDDRKNVLKSIIYIATIIGVCVMVSFVAIIRGGNRISLSAFLGEYNVFSLFLSEFGSTLITPILASSYVVDVGLLWGKNYLGALAVLIPLSSRFLSGIRAYMNVGAILNPYSPLKGALGGSLFADMIISFGNIGMLLSIPLGVFVAKISNRIKLTSKNDFWKCVSIYFSYGILLYVRGNAEDIGLTLKRTVYFIMLYFVFSHFWNRRKA